MYIVHFLFLLTYVEMKLLHNAHCTVFIIFLCCTQGSIKIRCKQGGLVAPIGQKKRGKCSFWPFAHLRRLFTAAQVQWSGNVFWTGGGRK